MLSDGCGSYPPSQTNKYGSDIFCTDGSNSGKLELWDGLHVFGQTENHRFPGNAHASKGNMAPLYFSPHKKHLQALHKIFVWLYVTA